MKKKQHAISINFISHIRKGYKGKDFSTPSGKEKLILKNIL